MWAMKRIGIAFFTFALTLVGFSSWTTIGNAQNAQEGQHFSPDPNVENTDDDTKEQAIVCFSEMANCNFKNSLMCCSFHNVGEDPDYTLDDSDDESSSRARICPRKMPKCKIKKFFALVKKLFPCCNAHYAKEIGKLFKKPILITLVAGKITLDLATLIFLVEHMQKTTGFKESLYEHKNANCSVDCFNNVAILENKANRAFLTDVLVGTPTCLGASITDLLAVSAFLCGHPDAALITFFISSGFNLVTFLSSIGTHAVIADGLQNHLGDMSEQIREKLMSVLAQSLKIVVPTGVEGFLGPIATCCAFWRRNKY